MKNYKKQEFPKSRIASIDVYEVGKQKHHVTGILEFDVSDCRQKIRNYNKASSNKISFNAWLIGAICRTIKKHENVSSFQYGKNKQLIFDDINVSVLVEKELDGQKVPFPLVVEKANEISIESITSQIAAAKNQKITANDIVLKEKTRRSENIYYLLPGFLRRYFWKYLLKHPKPAYKRMGNIAFTSVGMMGKVNGWFIPTSIHPICFGIGAIVKKPVVVNKNIEIREILNMTILLDHDVIDGANMARFISDLSRNIENGLLL